MKAVFLAEKDSPRIPFVFGHGRYGAYADIFELAPEWIGRGNFASHRDFLAEAEVAVATWEIPLFAEEELAEYFPRLKYLLYAAGSVQQFARPYLARGVRIVSAWGVMCRPVAEYTLAAILFANKGILRSFELYRQLDFQKSRNHFLHGYPGTYHTKVGILGAGMIGSLVIGMLRGHEVDVLVYDPYLSGERAESLGVRKTSLEEIFESCQTISNHIANNEQTKGILDYRLFSRMKDNATFINTGRGAQVVEADLLCALRERPDRTALLDVTWPEPATQEMLSQPNVFVSPHLAGFAEQEVLRMPDALLDIWKEHQKGLPLRFEVTMEMLSTMA